MAQWNRLPQYVHSLAAERPSSILLETSRHDPLNTHSYLFLTPASVIVANTLDDLPHVFSLIEQALADGFYAAGFFSYECGYHYERFAEAEFAGNGLPLAWFGTYQNPFVFDHAQGSFQGSVPPEHQKGRRIRPPASLPANVSLGIGHTDYCGSILKIKEYIASGDTYQVNFTDAVSFDTQMEPDTLFESLQKHQSVAYSALMNVAGHHILSLSPELFFRVDQGTIVTRPMKGTMPRGLDASEDEEAAIQLQNDEKNRSEHVMIVDLVRNDLGRICCVGTVCVKDLFAVERYETVLQMTSTVTGMLRPGICYYDLFRSLFPSGSVTGAPKIRTMQIIREMETNPRGIYTGSIGFFAPGGSAAFNVAIRTLVMKDGQVRMGVGGGVVADSNQEDEHRECLLKTAFLTNRHRDFQLIETLLWESDFLFLPMHLDRLEASALYFDFSFDREMVLSQLLAASLSFAMGTSYRVRVLMDSIGKLSIDHSELCSEQWNGSMRLSQERTSSLDIVFRHKTTCREIYDRQFAMARRDGFDETFFLNEREEVTEGAISNIFIERGGKLLTPPIGVGALPGIFRRHLLETHKTAEEQILTTDDLMTADSVFVCNSIRGLRRIDSICVDTLHSIGQGVRA